MPDLVITVVPQDPSVVHGSEDLAVSMLADDLAIQLPANDLVAVPLAQDLAVGVPLQDLGVVPTALGPPGPQGPAGPGGGVAVVVATAAQALGGQRVVKPVAGGVVDYASSDVATDGDKILGVTTGAANADADVNVQLSGSMVDNSFNWLVGLPIYCGLNGVMTQTPPTMGMLCRVGKALSPTEMVINVEEAIVLAS